MKYILLGQHRSRTAGSRSEPVQIAKGRRQDDLAFVRFRLVDYFGLESKILIPRNPMTALVAGGGFVPQPPLIPRNLLIL